MSQAPMDNDDLTEVLEVLYQGLMLCCAGLKRIIARRKQKRAGS
jgi:hypothetical protein